MFFFLAILKIVFKLFGKIMKYALFVLCRLRLILYESTALLTICNPRLLHLNVYFSQGNVTHNIQEY
jgi:hypothetical protein